MFDDMIKKKIVKPGEEIEIRKKKDAKPIVRKCPKCTSCHVISTGFQSIPPYTNVETMKCLKCGNVWHNLPMW